jgi:dTDP-4-amino-4,6-dideoxygalactose transaminase
MMESVEVRHSSSQVDEAEIKAAIDVLGTNFVGYGRVGRALEEAFCLRTGKRFGFAVSSGFHAISLALRALDLPESSVVSIPVLTCPSLVSAIQGAGHRVGLSDVRAEDLIINPPAVPPESGAIIAPHAYGAPLDVVALARLELPWIEDCATSPATLVAGRPAGSWGTLAVFSFNSTKYLTAGAGGMVLTDNPELADRIRCLLEPGSQQSVMWNNAHPAAFPGRLSDLNAAIALAQYGKLPVFLQRRKAIADSYIARLSGIKDFYLPENVDGHSYYRYIIRTRWPSEQLASRLQARGIDARTAVNPWLDSFREGHYVGSGFHGASLWKERMLSLPIHASMTEDQVRMVCDCIIELIN